MSSIFQFRAIFALSIFLAYFATTLADPVRANNVSSTTSTPSSRTNPGLVVFNRVPKVGSSMMLQLMQMLSEKNGWNFHRDGIHPGMKARLTCFEEDKLTNTLCNLPTTTVYSKHVAFINFSRSDCSEDVVHINMVRDPVERIISWFYYIRNPDVRSYFRDIHTEWPDVNEKWIKKDFEDCFLRRDPECSFDEVESLTATGNFWSQMMFFCGADPRCSIPNGRWALARAKVNVARHYAVVGVLEELENSLKVFESRLPKVFKGAAEIYAQNREQFSQVNQNEKKPFVSDKIKESVGAILDREMEFYEFCKKRLELQISKL